MNKTFSYTRDVPFDGSEYDVIVCGGGPSGTAAALSAARHGAKTLLIEAQGQLGGMATSGLVSHWLGGRLSDCETWVVGGIFRELSLRANLAGFARIPARAPEGCYSPYGWERGQLNAGVPFDPFRMAAMLDEVMAEAGVKVLLLTQVVDTVVKNDRIKSVVVANKNGICAFQGRIFIDATGDADLAARSGCDFVKGREEDGLSAPSTVEMHVSNVDVDTFSRYIHDNKTPRFLPEIEHWSEEGAWEFSFNRFITVQLNHDDTFMVNTSRLCGFDGTDAFSLSAAMAAGRRENLELFDFMRKHIPGFSGVRLKAMAPLAGIRESRRIVADYTLRVQDLCEARAFDDIIAYSSYGWDLPDPNKPSFQPMDDKNLHINNNRTPIPFRIMQPKPVMNLLCPGRAVSVERDVMGPVRVMAPCMAMGQAAGTAAAMSCECGDCLRLDVEMLRKALKNDGAVIE